MWEQAINPAYWWGATAVASPIIIHLINRMRFRRLAWAAMEFLLKSQQRNRRRILIEQLILLMLRCLIVLALVALVVRPTWWMGEAAQARRQELPHYHFIVLDDSLSMQDLEDAKQPNGPTAYRRATALIAKLVQDYLDVPGAHYLTFFRLSQPGAPEFGPPYVQLGDAPPGQLLTHDEVSRFLARLEATPATSLRLGADDWLSLFRGSAEIPGLSAYLGNIKRGHRYLHLVSDFRERDWNQEGFRPVLAQLGDWARSQDVQIRLYDIAAPSRARDNPQERPVSHGNLAITHVAARAQQRREEGTAASAVPVQVVAPGVPFDLEVTLRNFSANERQALRVGVRVDGVEKNEFARVVERIGSYEERTIRLDMRFYDTDSPGPKQITVYVEDGQQPDHLPADNVRHVYVELRRDLPVLLVDPDHLLDSPKPPSEYIASVLGASRRLGWRPERCRPNELKNRKLDDYPVIYLLNVPGVGTGPSDMDEDSLKALENYVRRGGSVVFFLGERVNVDLYNRFLYRNGQGIFPAPLALRPVPNSNLTFVDEAPDLDDTAPKARVLQTGHPAFNFPREMLEEFARFLQINRYYKVDPAWRPPTDVQVLMQLTNREPLTNFRLETVEIVQLLNQDTSPQRVILASYAQRMLNWVADAELKRSRKGPLLDAVAGLLTDQQLTEYWKRPDRKELRQRLERFQQRLLEGDPLVLESKVGTGTRRGTVIVFLTPANPSPIPGRNYSWNNWANEMFFSYVPMIVFLQSYLAGESRKAREIETSHLLTRAVEVRFDKEQYAPRVQLYYWPEGKSRDEAQALGAVAGTESEQEVVFRLHPQQAGFYVLRLNEPGEGITPKGEPESRILVFNPDCRDEGDLRRVAEADFQQQWLRALTEGEQRLAYHEAQQIVSRAPLLTEAAPPPQEYLRTKSWSDYSWVLLALLALLALEQFLAMLFSHHVPLGEKGLQPPPAARLVSMSSPAAEAATSSATAG
ncbi:MAG: BatA domain-containing protein [Gemmatales bacterium]|nr:BatA domain-containing protein [Gemmatales bacterium]MCS7161419.1 BatA domain-containing protein [Gemmatales bacterium]MDW8176622.1 BatA domain-containing protein [Gemmatales bacterium]MDW8222010.1 BatA domain-containing protein [Gemmatales bacterium]